jgi:hypothetical protein
MISIKQVASYTTSDGTSHTTREAAVKHEIYLQRVKNLTTVPLGDKNGLSFVNEDAGSDQRVLLITDIPQFIAENADAILAALTIKQNRGRAAKPAAPAPAAAA